MVQGFDPNKPVHSSNLRSDEVRENFNAVATNHSGPTAPPNPEEGWVWLDTTHNKYKHYKNGAWHLLAELDSNGDVFVDGGVI